MHVYSTYFGYFVYILYKLISILRGVLNVLHNLLTKDQGIFALSHPHPSPCHVLRLLLYKEPCGLLFQPDHCNLAFQPCLIFSTQEPLRLSYEGSQKADRIPAYKNSPWPTQLCFPISTLLTKLQLCFGFFEQGKWFPPRNFYKCGAASGPGMLSFAESAYLAPLHPSK